jgi:3-hydroxyanthranilate 3,4-dioxygenase
LKRVIDWGVCTLRTFQPKAIELPKHAMIKPPFNLKNWIDENRELLKPPIGNQCVYQQADDLIVMVVGGPNSRRDFHYNENEELFFQIHGAITLKTVVDEKIVDVVINEGDIFLLPGRTLHSPRRPADTIGVVIETSRKSGQKDGCVWFCENCDAKIYEEYFVLKEPKEIVTKLTAITERFNQSIEMRTCSTCGHVLKV